MFMSYNVRTICNSLWTGFGYQRRSLLSKSIRGLIYIGDLPSLPVSPLSLIARFKSRTATSDAAAAADTGVQSSLLESIVSVSNLLGLGCGKTKLIFKKLPGYSTTPIGTLRERHDALVQQGVSEERFKKLPHLLLQEPDKLKKTASYVAKTFGISVEAAYAFAHLSEIELGAIKKTWARERSILKGAGYSQRNRLFFLRDRLSCTETEAADMIQASSLFTLSLERICSTTELLLGAGIDSAHIRKDPWIFHLSNLEKVKTRLTTLQSNQVHPIKPWMLRAAESEFTLYIKNDVDEQNLMKGKANHVEFLASTLQCSLDDASRVVRKEASLKLLKARTIHAKITFLLNNGYGKDELILHPRILTRNLDKTEERYQKFLQAGHRPSLKVLGKSQKECSAFLYKFLGKETDKSIDDDL